MARKKKGRVTLEQAKKHYSEKVPVMPANYNDGMKRFFGQDVSSSLPATHYSEKIRPGVEDTWANQLRKAFNLR